MLFLIYILILFQLANMGCFGKGSEPRESYPQTKVKPGPKEKPPPKPAPVKPPAPSPPVIVERKSLHDLSEDEAKRFVAAIKKLMENKKDKDGNDMAGTSEYARIAGMHGFPGKYTAQEWETSGTAYRDASFCRHASEAFPVWHRYYLRELEISMQRADKENGNDGNIGLPYWDWYSLVTTPAGDYVELDNSKATGPIDLLPKWYTDAFPSGVEDEEFNKVRDALLPKLKSPVGSTTSRANSWRLTYERFINGIPEDEEELKKRGFTTLEELKPRPRVRGYEYKSQLGFMDLAMPAIALSASIEQPTGHCFNAGKNYIPASGNISVEAPHDTLHVRMGFPMVTVELAAFNPLFFMHHCLIDAAYESFLIRFGHDNAHESYRVNQKMQDDSGQELDSSRFAPNVYEDDMRPFRERNAKGEETKKFLKPAQGFDTKALGYTYPNPPKSFKPRDNTKSMTEAPVLVALGGLNNRNFQEFSVDFHIFLHNKNDEFAPPENDDYWSSDNYAGSLAVFGGRGMHCENCELSANYTLSMDVTELMKHKLHLTKNTVKVAVVCKRSFPFDDVVPIQEFVDQGITSKPRLIGPMFDTDADLSKVADDNVDEDVRDVQKILFKLGFYPKEAKLDEIDGKFGPHTDAAIRKFQEMNVESVEGKKVLTMSVQSRVFLHKVCRELLSQLMALLVNEPNHVYLRGSTILSMRLKAMSERSIKKLSKYGLVQVLDIWIGQLCWMKLMNAWPCGLP